MTTSKTTPSEQIGKLLTENAELCEALVRRQHKIDLLEKALYDTANPEGGKVELPVYAHIL